MVCLMAFISQEIGQNYVFENIQHPGSEKGHTVFFLVCSVGVYSGLHFRNNRGAKPHNAGPLI